jgi:hypothetical protein
MHPTLKNKYYAKSSKTMKSENIKKYPTQHIFKSTGQLEVFSAKKLERSLQRSGLSQKESRDITIKVSKNIKPGSKTRDIFKDAFKLVHKKSPIAATHYSLKQSLLELGPTGFEFEYFVSKYFEALGFKTFVGVILQGQFVRHEVDVIASKSNYQIYIECKFHNTSGRTNDIKTVLYIKARWDDLKNGSDGKYLKEYFLASNTAFSKDAIEYSKGVGLQLLGVNTPEGESFLDKIKKLKLFPITSLKRLKKIYCQELLLNKIILCRDLLNEKILLKKMGLTDTEIQLIFNDVKKILE